MFFYHLAVENLYVIFVIERNVCETFTGRSAHLGSLFITLKVVPFMSQKITNFMRRKNEIDHDLRLRFC
jgi:hypothetical protein